MAPDATRSALWSSELLHYRRVGPGRRGAMVAAYTPRPQAASGSRKA